MDEERIVIHSKNQAYCISRRPSFRLRAYLPWLVLDSSLSTVFNRKLLRGFRVWPWIILAPEIFKLHPHTIPFDPMSTSTSRQLSESMATTTIKPNLPLDVWLEVFRYLDYANLVKLYLVHPYFHEVLSSPCFDSALWRAPNTTVSSSHMRLHPVLVCPIYYLQTEPRPNSVWQIKLYTRRGNRVAFADTSAAAACAVWPPVKTMKILARGYVLKIRSARYITTADVYDTLTKKFGRQTSLFWGFRILMSSASNGGCLKIKADVWWETLEPSSQSLREQALRS